MIAFDLPFALAIGAPLVLGLLVLAALHLARRDVPSPRVAALVALRGLALLALVVLAARPVRVESEDRRLRRAVAILLDRSESMSLTEAGRTRYERALDFARGRLVPALEKAGWTVQGLLFAEGSEAAPTAQFAAATPDGRRTDLAGAIVHAVTGTQPPPLALVALTDGAANENASNAAALNALLETRTPFLGVGFGQDGGVASLSLGRVSAPPVVPPKQGFQVSAQIRAVSGGEVPAFDLILLRDGRMRDRRRIPAGQGSRFWSESFRVAEDDEGVHEYTVELVLPARKDLVCVKTQASAHVQVSREREFRVLFAQGTLTWDFKFIGLALRADPTIRVTGLSRTSKQSVFRQNVESAGELTEGFPETLAQIAPYRVVVLSDLKPSDLTPVQQDVIARFCGELGGGVLLIGGPTTFDASWQGSRLEQLLPVAFDSSPGVVGLDKPFHLRLTDEALASPVFQVAESAGASRAVWAGLPTFSQYGRVLGAKPAATVWATHDEDRGPQGRRIMMASQPYGAGLSAVIGLQNFWRWRLAKDADPQQFDRFWQQLFRYLGQSGRQDVGIEFPDQTLLPRSDIRAVLERQPRPEGTAKPAASADSHSVRVVGPDRQPILERKLELLPLRPVEISFRAEKEGTHTVVVRDAHDLQVASRMVEVRDVDREMLRTGRDMENLRQWARVSQGLALPAEECEDGEGLVARLKKQLAGLQGGRRLRLPLGLDGWGMSGVLALVCGEWLLRRRWGLA